MAASRGKARKSEPLAPPVKKTQSQHAAEKPERQRFARERLLKWVPRVRVVAELQAKFGVELSAAYSDCAAVWDEVADAQQATKRQQIARVTALLDEQIEEVKSSDEKPTAKAHAVDALADRLAKIGGLYPDTGRLVVIRNELRVLAGLSDEQLDAMIVNEERRMLKAGGDGDVVDAEIVAEPTPRARRRRGA